MPIITVRGCIDCTLKMIDFIPEANFKINVSSWLSLRAVNEQLCHLELLLLLLAEARQEWREIFLKFENMFKKDVEAVQRSSANCFAINMYLK